MAEDNVRKIYGIGPITEQALNAHSIYTVQDLASTDPKKFPQIPKITTYCTRAKDYLRSMNGESDRASASASIAVTASQPKDHRMPPPTHTDRQANGQKAAPKTNSDAGSDDGLEYFISDHSWFHQIVTLPVRTGCWRKAVIFEMCIDPTSRVAVSCTWEEPSSHGDTKTNGISNSDDDDDTECMMDTFSPQYIAHFNPQLPVLTIRMTNEDWQSIPHKHTIQDVLNEVGTMVRTTSVYR